MATISLEQATAVKERHEQDWIKRPGVTGVDVGYREATQFSRRPNVVHASWRPCKDRW